MSFVKPRNILIASVAALLVIGLLMHKYKEGFVSTSPGPSGLGADKPSSTAPGPSTTPAGWGTIFFIIFVLFAIAGFIFSKIGLFNPNN